MPDGVCAVEVTVLGAAGGSAINTSIGANGAGASITATFDVVPGMPYSGVVGGGGGTPSGSGSGSTPGSGGSNGGGTGGFSGSQVSGTRHHGAGGGGASELTLGTELAVLAGGGGGSAGGHSTGADGRGGDAGRPAGTGVTPGFDGEEGKDTPAASVGGGQGGTAAAPGAGGVHSASAAVNGFPGVGRNGGAGGDDPGPDAGGGGGAGYFGAGGGASTVGYNTQNGATEITGAGGGGGASYIAPSIPLGGTTVAPSGISSTAGPKLSGTGAGANGAVTLDWVECSYDLAVTKTASTELVAPGGTITWTIAVTNQGPDPMTSGDLVTITDTLPGAGDRTITGISVSGGGNSVLQRGPITCSASDGDPMPSSLTCGRPYALIGDPAGTAQRGLDVDETLTVTYTQEVTEATGTVFTNTATVTDRTTGDADDTASDTVTVGIPPAAVDDLDLGNQIGTPVTLPVLDNDAGTLVPGSVVILDPGTGNPVAGPYVVPGEGSWTVDPASGAITFTPEPGFLTDPTPVTYRVTDTNGIEVTAEVTVTYVPDAVNDADLGNTLGTAVAVDILANDIGDLVPSSVRFIDPVSGSAVSTLTVPGEGTWTLDPATGRATFAPEPGFTGNPTVVGYRVTDSTGDVVEATITITYLPAATDDSSTGNRRGTTVTVDPLANDRGSLDPASVRLIDPTGARVLTLTVPGEGEWIVDPVTGEVAFAPEPGFDGDPTPVPYEVRDLLGNPTTASITITYLPAGVIALTGSEILPVAGAGLAALAAGIGLAAAGFRRRRRA